MIEKVLSDSSALFLFWLFASAGFGKLKPENRQYYSSLISDYFGAVGEKFGFIVLLVGSLEIVSGLLMLSPATRHIGTAFILILLAAYLSLMIYQIYQGKVNQDCGCAGPHSNIKVGIETITRNVVLCGIAALCALPAVGDFYLTFGLSLCLSLFMALTYLSAEKTISNLQKSKLLQGR